MGSRHVKQIFSAIALAVLALATSLNAVFVLLRRVELSELSDFVFYIRKNYIKLVKWWMTFMLTCWCFQGILEQVFGGFEALMWKYGVVDEMIISGQWWRLLSGPLIHANFIHWFSNFSLILLVAPAATLVSKRMAVFTFFSGVVLSASATVFLDHHHDSFVGVSGGICSLLAWLGAISISKQGMLPKRFWVECAVLFLLSFGVTVLLTPNASASAHAVGGLWGMFVGFVGSCFLHSDEYIKWHVYLTPSARLG